MYDICPICHGALALQERSVLILDGRTIYNCTLSKLHRFWYHPFECNMLYWHPDASQSNTEWYKSFEYVEGKIVKIHLNEKTIGQY
jgi:hypothetical protein